VAIGLTLIGVFLGNTGHSSATPMNFDQPAQLARTPKTVPATPAERHVAESVLMRFVRSAIVRRHLAASWPLATPHMKIGTSHADWLAGDLPVFPYPAAALKSVGLTLKYSYKRVLGFDALLVPTTDAVGRKTGQQVYTCELHDLHGRWLVDFCYLSQTL